MIRISGYTAFLYLLLTGCRPIKPLPVVHPGDLNWFRHSRYENNSQTYKLYQKFITDPYPSVSRASFWVCNARLQPVTNASITCTGKNGFTITLTQSDTQGLYILDTIAAGIYRVEISADNYETQIQQIQIYQPNKLRRKIALGEKGSIYLPTHWGFFPLTNPTENVKIGLKHDCSDTNSDRREAYVSNLYKEIKNLRLSIDSADTLHQYHDVCLSWPADSLKRIRFRNMIENSEIMQTSFLYPMGSCGLPATYVPYVNFRLRIDTDENTIRSVLSKHGFSILRQYANGVSSSYPDYLDIEAIYLRPLSLDFLRNIYAVNNAIPLLYCNIDELVYAEPNMEE